MKFILRNRLKFAALALITPIFFNLIIYLSSSNIFSLILSINIIFYLLLLSIWFYLTKYRSTKRPRSPFEYIKLFNTTNDKTYWDEFKKPLKHLKGIEIGVYEGDNAAKILNFLNIKKLYLVDPWREYVNNLDYGKIVDNQKTQDERYEFVKKRFQKNSEVEILRMDSAAAVKLFPDNFFDFIYIDGDHSYEAVKNDLHMWHPKLKKYGVMCGDDFSHISGRGVIEAVQEFSFEKKLIIQTMGSKDTQFWYVKTK